MAKNKLGIEKIVLIGGPEHLALKEVDDSDGRPVTEYRQVNTHTRTVDVYSYVSGLHLHRDTTRRCFAWLRRINLIGKGDA